ncbi:hypothetical protein PPERSA_03517 [Pseudocohnilembus persalinus]|uniref:PDEase domain-containing protein n=1 Tax=Pseudocohnilembus persalinus TaxID=266149 RepID=A0A0V0R2A9_PSEPJ|nr:hypothetical protein PPERSA_03517 [Pseudocohnilembus persalinus]|eukprot:KRX08646.1 hypothetical protein PPERSA_03517 [Pseudocohnilembus persalinus]
MHLNFKSEKIIKKKKKQLNGFYYTNRNQNFKAEMIESDKQLKQFQKFVTFLNVLEQKYNKNYNTFHNFTHGVSVMQCCYSIALSQKAQKYLSDFNVFGLSLSGLCHDVSHPAHTNIFAIKSMSKLALRYHDESPLEQHHAAVTFKIIKRIGLLDNINKQQFDILRKDVIQNILHTDNSNHQKLLQAFQNAISNGFEEPQCLEYNKQLLQGMIIHAADFTGGAKDIETSMEWSIRCNQEFKNQYDLEGQIGIEQTVFMKDLHKIDVLAKGEKGFFKMLVLPLWIQLNDFLEGFLNQNVQNLLNVIQTWDKISQEPQKYKIEFDKLNQLQERIKGNIIQQNGNNNNIVQEFEEQDKQQYQNHLEKINKIDSFQQQYQKNLVQNNNAFQE